MMRLVVRAIDYASTAALSDGSVASSSAQSFHDLQFHGAGLGRRAQDVRECSTFSSKVTPVKR